MKLYLIIPLLLLVACTTTAPVQKQQPLVCPSNHCPACSTNTPITDKLDVYFIDVGEGDASLIKYKDTEMLIDCGKNSAAPIVTEFLKEKNVTELEYLLVTHPDADHIGGCDEVLKQFKVRTVIKNSYVSNTKSYQDVQAQLDTEQVIIANDTQHYLIGKAGMFIIQALPSNESDTNYGSVVSKLLFGNVSFLFTGDCDDGCEDVLINKDVQSDILKVAHHGSKFGTKIKFVEKVKPSLAVISVGDNQYGHPTEETIDRLSQEGAVIYRTDLDGNIKIETDGSGWVVTIKDV